MGLKGRLIHWLLRIYPERWRSEYGVELEALLESRELTAWTAMDVARGGFVQRMSRGKPWEIAAPPLLAWALIGVVWNTLSPFTTLFYNAYLLCAWICLVGPASATTWRRPGNAGAAVLGAVEAMLIVVHPVIMHIQGQSHLGNRWLTLLYVGTDLGGGGHAIERLWTEILIPSTVGMLIGSLSAAFGASARLLRDATHLK